MPVNSAIRIRKVRLESGIADYSVRCLTLKVPAAADASTTATRFWSFRRDGRKVPSMHNINYNIKKRSA